MATAVETTGVKMMMGRRTMTTARGNTSSSGHLRTTTRSHASWQPEEDLVGAPAKLEEWRRSRLSPAELAKEKAAEQAKAAAEAKAKADAQAK
eukprot:6501015-Prymnesium_polylepis.1